MKKLMLLVMLVMLCSPAYALTSFSQGRKTVTTGGTAEAIAPSSRAFTVAEICAETDNTGTIVLGEAPIAALATRQGVPLGAGDCITIRPNVLGYADLANIKIDTTVNGDGVTFMYFIEEKI